MNQELQLKFPQSYYSLILFSGAHTILGYLKNTVTQLWVLHIHVLNIE